jgi:hypothetical protein
MVYKVQIKQEISQMLIFYFRLADAYLMYAECAVRGAGGSLATATKYVNALRTRAKGQPLLKEILI